MSDRDRDQSEENSFSYMEELSEAYRKAFAERIAKAGRRLPEEKRDLILKMQLELSRCAGKLALAFRSDEKKELSRMIKESAEEVLRALAYDEEEGYGEDTLSALPPALILSRAVLIANRSLNLLVRHERCESRPINLILSELSALYALAAIN